MSSDAVSICRKIPVSSEDNEDEAGTNLDDHVNRAVTLLLKDAVGGPDEKASGLKKVDLL
jgi:hypothetical protein